MLTTDGRLKEAGWRVVRVWDHEDSAVAAAAIAIKNSRTTNLTFRLRPHATRAILAKRAER